MFVWFWNLDCIVLIPEYYEKEILCCIMEQEAILNNNWSTLFLVLGWIVLEKLGEENTVCHSQPLLDAFWYSLSDLASLNNVIKIGKRACKSTLPSGHSCMIMQPNSQSPWLISTSTIYSFSCIVAVRTLTLELLDDG